MSIAWNMLKLTLAISGFLLPFLADQVPARAETIIDNWAKVRVPAPPQLMNVSIEPKTTALLLLDFNGAQDPAKGPCNAKTKPRCLASLSNLKALLTSAQKAGLYVVWSVGGNGERQDIATDLAPGVNDPVVKSGPDKFVNTNLGALLEAKGIKTVIVTGTSSEGAVLMTAAHAALQGMNIVLPVDGMSSTEPYGEQYVAWHFANAPGVSMKTTLTSIDRIKSALLQSNR